MEKQPTVYILTNNQNTTLYVGVTSNLQARVWQHKSDLIKGFSQKYQTHKLVHYELFSDMLTAIEREKQLKNWRRQWKINLVTRHNTGWEDLYGDLI